MNIQSILEIIGEAYVEEITAQLVRYGLEDSMIIKDISYTIQNNTVIINIPDYAVYIEDGRRPSLEIETRVVPRVKPIMIKGKLSTTKKVYKYKGLPNLGAIQKWVKRKKIDTNSSISINALTFLIARSIARNGILARPFLRDATKVLEKEIDEIFAIQFSDLIDENIKRILNI